MTAPLTGGDPRLVEAARIEGAAGPLRCRLVGSGPVGLAFCLFALRAGLEPAQIGIDRDRIETLAGRGRQRPPTPLRRQLAIAEGSRQLLDRIIAFPPAAPIEQIDVELAGRRGRTRIVAADFGVAALGRVVTHQRLTRALAEAVADAWAETPADVRAAASVDAGAAPSAEAGANAAAPASPTPIDPAGVDPAARIDLEIQAEGLIEGDAADRLEFGQSALLAEVVASAPPTPGPATAYERFDRDGPLALLPIVDDSGADGTGRRFTMVWCDNDAACAERLGWPRARLEAALGERFGATLGPLSIDGPIDRAPLTRIRRRPERRGADGPARVWIGNAAQALHPVAGQGLNLGLRDAFELARLLGELNETMLASRGRTDSARATVGAALDDFERERGRDRATLVAVTDGLARGFALTGLHRLQSTLLTALDLVPALRRPLAATLLYGRRQ